MIFKPVLLLIALPTLSALMFNMANFKESALSHDKVVVCYWGTWSNYRPGSGKFNHHDIDASLCTHLVYSFAGIDLNTSTIKSLDEWMDLDSGLGGFRGVTDLKIHHHHLKVTLAIGGWNEGSEKFSSVTSAASTRKIFVESVVEFLKKHKFDGLDIDWEYPASRGGKPDDKQNFIHLIRDLRAAFDQQGFILTAAIGASKTIIDEAYDVIPMFQYLDLVHVMCYDYFGNWNSVTGHNAPLKAEPESEVADRRLSVESTIEYLLQLGAKPEKTVLGVPFYGRTFVLADVADADVHKVGAKVQSGRAFKGPYTREDGFLGYNEICELSQNETSDWTVAFDRNSRTPFMSEGFKWISYDDEASIRLKTDFAYDKKLAGVMVWSIDTDDFGGACLNKTKFPLLRAINNQLHINAIKSHDLEDSVAFDYWLAIYALVALVAFVFFVCAVFKIVAKVFLFVVVKKRQPRNGPASTN